MLREKELLITKDDSEIADVTKYEEEDIFVLQELFTDWMNLNEKLKKIGGRPTILPPEIVEGLVACKMGYWRVNSMMHAGFDCFDPNSPQNYNRIEIKYTTGRADFTSFSPYFKWDRLNFVKINIESSRECFFEIYDIDFQEVLERYNGTDFRPRLRIMREFIDQGIYNKKIEFSIF